MENLPDLIGGWPLWVQYSLAVLVLIGAMMALADQTMCRLWRWAMPRSWAGREKWNAGCLPPTQEEPNRDSPLTNPKAAFDKSLGLERWSQMREMRAGDYYRLNIGKPRLISRIQFKTQPKDSRYPKRYRLCVQEDERGNMHEIGVFDGPIDETIEPQKIQIIEVPVVKPMLA